MSLVGYRNHCKYAPKRPLIAHEFFVKDEWQKGLPPSPTGNPASAFTLQNSTHSQNLVTFSGPPCPPFLALPLDVRLDIYHHAFRGRLVLVDRVRKRHNQWHDCYQIHYHDEWYDEYADTFKWSAGLCNLSGNPAHDTDENGDGEWAGSRTPFPRINSCHCLNAPTWPLLCLCRQVYFEALPVFYRSASSPSPAQGISGTFMSELTRTLRFWRIVRRPRVGTIRRWRLRRLPIRAGPGPSLPSQART
jgi:hypothetical protein